MTPGEMRMASTLFGDAIDYAKVEVHARRYLPFGLQPKNCAMTPNGTIYFDASRCLSDFSAGDEHTRHWFMHEMVHVWQHQLGYPVWWRGGLRIGLSYAYELAAHKRLADFNMEAQGDLLADYYALKFLRSSRAMAQQRYARSLALFETVLDGFRRDPAARIHLPGAWR